MMKALGEPFNDDEQKKFEDAAANLPGNKPGLINILDLSKLFLPDLEKEVEAEMIAGEAAKTGVPKKNNTANE